MSKRKVVTTMSSYPSELCRLASSVQAAIFWDKTSLETVVAVPCVTPVLVEKQTNDRSLLTAFMVPLFVKNGCCTDPQGMAGHWRADASRRSLNFWMERAGDITLVVPTVRDMSRKHNGL